MLNHNPSELASLLSQPLTQEMLDSRNAHALNPEDPSVTMELRAGGIQLLVSPELQSSPISQHSKAVYKELAPSAARLLETMLKLPDGTYVRQDLLTALKVSNPNTKPMTLLSNDISHGSARLGMIAVVGNGKLLDIDKTKPRRSKFSLYGGLFVKLAGWKNTT